MRRPLGLLILLLSLTLGISSVKAAEPPPSPLPTPFPTPTPDASPVPTANPDPTVPGTPVTGTPTADTTPTWQWVGSVFMVEGELVDPTGYDFSWYQPQNQTATQQKVRLVCDQSLLQPDPPFLPLDCSGDVLSYTHTTALTPGLWYAFVQAFLVGGATIPIEPFRVSELAFPQVVLPITPSDPSETGAVVIEAFTPGGGTGPETLGAANRPDGRRVIQSAGFGGGSLSGLDALPEAGSNATALIIPTLILTFLYVATVWRRSA